MLEYRKAMRAIANGFDTGDWPAPITEDYAATILICAVSKRCAYRHKGNNNVQFSRNY